MLINQTITKKVLEKIVHETFSNLGSLSSSSLLDSLKLLGFYYATNAGISINIEDIKTPNIKKDVLKKVHDKMVFISEQWQQGFVSDTERFQTIIDEWNFASESLKNRILEYYQNFDPANNLYIMAFSGARGNISQVRQLVGMRGLMSDQEGKIIDLPIQNNFCEGLTSIDYIISSYGARKGIVDTALKTADSGYLTRRLIYLAQDLVIRQIDCSTKKGVIFLLNKKNNGKNLLGRFLLSAKSANSPYISLKPESLENLVIEENIIEELKKNSPLSLKIRSPLTCEANASICQKCYGWDLAKNKLISLGEAVGIIAAQSIGEPGTQLTMRTFHTGGIFTSETLKQIVAPFSGKIFLPAAMKTISYRTNHGVLVSKLQQEATLTIVNWNGMKEIISLEIGYFLYINSDSFIKKGDLIAEYSTQSFLAGVRRLKPIYTSFSGEIRFQNLLVRKILYEKGTVKVNQDNGILWLTSGKILSLPFELDFKYTTKLKKTKSFGHLILSSPYEGIISFDKEKIIIFNKNKKILIEFFPQNKLFKNSFYKFSSLVKNFQYIDKYTILGHIDVFTNYEGTIYSIRKKQFRKTSPFYKKVVPFFFLTQDDIWKINSDQLNNFNFFPEKKDIIRSGKLLNSNSKFDRYGFFVKKEGFRMLFQKAIPIFLSRGTILNYKQGDFVLKNEIFANLVNYTQQTEDIVQGLPKIEELIEARHPKIRCNLCLKPGILLNYSTDKKTNNISFEISKNIIFCNPAKEDSLKVETNSISKWRQEKYYINIGHSIFFKNQIICFQKNLFKAIKMDKSFQPLNKTTRKKINFLFTKKNKKQILRPNGKKANGNWVPLLQKENNLSLIIKERHNKEKEIKIKKNSLYFKNKNLDFIVQLEDNTFIYLQNLNPIEEYEIPIVSPLLFELGNFIDIGEPLTEGIIDVHELLKIFFNYHYILDGTLIGVFRSLNKFQLLLVNSIQSIYQSQGVNISSKHIEIIVRQMTSRVNIKSPGDTPLVSGEVIKLSLITEIYKSFITNKNYRAPRYEPLLSSTTNSCLRKDGFLSAAGFQETKRVLSKAAIEGSTDWLRGLKECVIIGRLIPAGSAFLNYKNYLDNIYLFKDQ